MLCEVFGEPNDLFTIIRKKKSKSFPKTKINDGTEPDSKLNILRWVENVHIIGLGGGGGQSLSKTENC